MTEAIRFIGCVRAQRPAFLSHLVPFANFSKTADPSPSDRGTHHGLPPLVKMTLTENFGTFADNGCVPELQKRHPFSIPCQDHLSTGDAAVIAKYGLGVSAGFVGPFLAQLDTDAIELIAKR